MSELLPCPFCGGKAYLGRNPTTVAVVCDNDDCPASAYVAEDTDTAAVAAWNTRAAMPQGEPVAFMFWNDPDTQRHFSQLRETIGSYWTRIEPLYASPSLPVSEPGVRERIYNVALAELEKKRLMPTSVTLATAIANAAAAALTSPSNGKAQP